MAPWTRLPLVVFWVALMVPPLVAQEEAPPGSPGNAAAGASPGEESNPGKPAEKTTRVLTLMLAHEY